VTPEQGGLPWQPLSVPRSDLKVPALLVGQNKLPSSGCFADAPVTTSRAADQGSWSVDKSDQLGASLKASFKNPLIDAGVAADAASARTQNWKVEVTGLTYDSVDASSVQANFDNEACTDADLDWFKNKRFVATEALKAATVTVKAASALSDSEKAQLDLAIDKINTALHTSFSHASNTGNSSEFSASNVYIGVNGTELGSFDCQLNAPLDVSPDVQTPICDGRYQVALSKSAMTGRYSVKLTPQRAATSQFDAPLGSQSMFKLGKLQILFVMAEATGDKFTLKALEVLKVGAKG
jgi:hypothetical protein